MNASSVKRFNKRVLMAAMVGLMGAGLSAPSLAADKELVLGVNDALTGPGAVYGLPQANALRALWRLTLALSDERDRVRGKPEARHRVDFSFYLDLDAQGAQTVRIVQRRRDAGEVDQGPVAPVQRRQRGQTHGGCAGAFDRFQKG